MSRLAFLLLVLLSGRGWAQTFFVEGFESAGFVAVDGGFTVFDDADPLSVFSWTGDAGVVGGAQALVVQRTMTTGSGAANSDLLRAGFAGRTGTVSLQTWLRLDSTSGFYGAWPFQVHGLGNPLGTNAEIVIQGTTPQLHVQTGGRAGFRRCPSTMTLPDAGWHLLELITTGNGTDAGLARGFIDGVAFCESDNDWSGYPMGSLLIGTSAYERGWSGTMVLDELRVGDGVLVDRLEVIAPSLSGAQGACLPFTLDTGGIEDAGVLDRVVSVSWSSVPQGIVALSSSGCGDWDGGAGSQTVPLAGRTEYGVKLVGAGSAQVRVNSVGLLGGSTLRFDVTARDAGEVEPRPQQLSVGCSCDSTIGAVWGLLLVFALRRRSAVHGQ